MRQRVPLMAVVLCWSAYLCAQSEDALFDYFEGRIAVAKADLPASRTGVNISPEAPASTNTAEYRKQLGEFGVGIRRNQPLAITNIKVKPKSIELDLGGGYFTSTGASSSPTVYVAADKTQRERTLERDLDRETDPEKKEKMQKELDEVRARRFREDARLKAALAQASGSRQDASQPRTSTSGSRFNLVFPNGVPSRALTPEYIEATLRPWISFDRQPVSSASEEQPRPAEPLPAPNENPASSPTLHKGLTETELEHMYGEPIKREPGTQGDLHVEVLTFKQDGSMLEATMVEGVLVRFRQWSY